MAHHQNRNRRKIKYVRVPIKASQHKNFHRVRNLGHMGYFALVAIFSHDIYAYAAGALFVVGIIGIFLREEV